MPRNSPAKFVGASPVYLLLAVSGLSFCFFLGFPFDNHNESYLWVVALNKASFWEALTRPIIKMESFRPLGMANAWLTYRLSGNIYLQELLNWLFAASSFVVLFAAARNKIFFSLLAALTTACFFAGYVYLFHLHGVFYGPFQLYVALLTFIASRKTHLNAKMLAITAGFTFIVAMYHTFALLVYCAFLAGYAIQIYKNSNKKQYIQIALAFAATLVLAKIILEHKEVLSTKAMTNGLITSYTLTEINKVITGIAIIMSILAIAPLLKTTRWLIAACLATVAVSAVFVYLHFPVLLLWIAICVVKAASEKKWAMAGLVAATAVLPVGSGSGSPTYVVFVLMICAFLTAEDPRYTIRDSPAINRLATLVVLLVFGCLLLVRAGVSVPVVSLIAKPILSEKEKTQQLNDIINWKVKDIQYDSFRLLLYDSWELPVNAKNSITRANRPVTRQTDLDYYVDFLTGGQHSADKPRVLYVTFGNQVPDGKEPVFSVKGKWNGNAAVFR